MEIFLIAVHVMVCIVLIITVLIQHGKGADIGAVFGGGASNTVFGSRGAGNFLSKLTTGAAILFMVTSLSLSYLANTRANRSLFDDLEPEATGPVAPGEAESAAGGFEEVETAIPAPPGETEATGTPAADEPGANSTTE